MALMRSVISLCRQSYTCLFINLAKRQNVRWFASNAGETNEEDEECPRDIEIRSKMFPTKDHMKLVFDGIVYTELPIVHISTSLGNTIISLQNGDKVLTSSSGGKVGFRGRAKASNMAAQTIAADVAQKALFNDIKTIRVCAAGIGPGRWPAIKALESAGLKIVSITDTTKLPFNGNRPRKPPRK